MQKRAFPSLKKLAKYMLVAGIILLIFLVLKSVFLKEGFQDPTIPPSPSPSQSPIELPISATDLQKQNTTIAIPPGIAASQLTNIYFKIWNPKTNSWGQKMDQTNLPRTYDMGGTTLSFSNGLTSLKKPNYRAGLLGTQKKMPIAMTDLDRNNGIMIKGLNTANLGMLPTTGDATGSKVLVGLEFV
jgi:hypothetical protein